MRSLYELERAVDNNHVIITNSVDTLVSKVGSMEGVQVGSSQMRISNVETTPGTIPSAGVLLWDTTRHRLLVSDGTSMWDTTNGSAAA